MASTDIEEIIDKFNSFTQKPIKFLAVQEDVREDVKNLVKRLYDFTKSQENDSKKEKKSALSELIIQDFDEEQIWQEIELQNNQCCDDLVWQVANCMTNKNTLEFPVKVADDESDVEGEEKVSEDDEQLALEEESLQDTEDGSKIIKKKYSKSKSKPKVKSSIVDDKFFKLKEMEQFLLKEERMEDRKVAPDSDEESIDMFEDIDDGGEVSEEEGEEGNDRKMMYNDFFDPEDGDGNNYEQESGSEDEQSDKELQNENIDKQSQELKAKMSEKKVTFADMSNDNSSSDDDSDLEANAKTVTQSDNEKKSEFELRQQRLQQTIQRLEDRTLKEAPWQLKGEINASKRPQNSLLAEVVDFDLTSRPAPIITEQTTLTLEDIIRQRVKDKAWDDVVRKQKAVDNQLSFRKQEVLDHSKSKLSLAQVYEAEYLKQKQALSGEVEDEKEPEAHTEIRGSMSKLFAKLDALCHYHYTPRAPQAEVKIVSNTPAISMEEVAPVATSDAALLAPEEVKKKRRGELTSKEERTDTDKKRERRKKKKHQQQKGHVQKVTEHRNTKKGTEANDKSLKTSKAFFQQLNDDSTSLIKNRKNIKSKG